MRSTTLLIIFAIMAGSIYYGFTQTEPVDAKYSEGEQSFLNETGLNSSNMDNSSFFGDFMSRCHEPRYIFIFWIPYGCLTMLIVESSIMRGGVCWYGYGSGSIRRAHRSRSYSPSVSHTPTKIERAHRCSYCGSKVISDAVCCSQCGAPKET